MSVEDTDETPKYQQKMAARISHFTAYNLDALFILTHIPGSSA